MLNHERLPPRAQQSRDPDRMFNGLFAGTRRLPARVPENLRVYAIGDLHGRADLLEEMLARIDADLDERPVAAALQVFLGDYVDRGPASRTVIERLIARSETHRTMCLAGNHEVYLREFLRHPAVLDSWRHLGGLETLMSYGLRPSINPDAVEQAELSAGLNAAMPARHKRFLAALAPSFQCGDYFFVHAGVRPGIPLAQQDEEDLTSIREEFLASEDDFGKVVVHGHTPVQAPDVRHNRINIDTGAYATGRLTCLVLDRGERSFLAGHSRRTATVHAFSASRRGRQRMVAALNAVAADTIRAADDVARAARDAVRAVELAQRGNVVRLPAATPLPVPVPLPAPAPLATAAAEPAVAAEPLAAPAPTTPALRGPPPRPRVGRLTRAGRVVRAVVAVSGLAMIVAVGLPLLPGLGDQTAALQAVLRARDGLQPAAAERPSAPRLVVRPPALAAIDTDLPLGLGVAGDGVGTAVEINGLAPGSVLSAGRALGPHGWRLPVAELGGVRVRPPAGFGGAMSLVLELRRADDSVIERRSLRLEWIAPTGELPPAQGERPRSRRSTSAEAAEGFTPLVSREGNDPARAVVPAPPKVPPESGSPRQSRPAS
jgi:serine/threonine protein phosphatase 1